MEASEVLLWQEWLIKEPRGYRRDDIHTAQICQALFTVMQAFSGDKGAKPISIDDCILKFKEVEKQDQLKESELEEENMKIAMGMIASFKPKNMPKEFLNDFSKKYGVKEDLTESNIIKD